MTKASSVMNLEGTESFGSSENVNGQDLNKTG